MIKKIHSNPRNKTIVTQKSLKPVNFIENMSTENQCTETATLVVRRPEIRRRSTGGSGDYANTIAHKKIGIRVPVPSCRKFTLRSISCCESNDLSPQLQPHEQIAEALNHILSVKEGDEQGKVGINDSCKREPRSLKRAKKLRRSLSIDEITMKRNNKRDG